MSDLASNDDVIHFSSGEGNPCDGLTAKTSEILKAFNSHTFSDDVWVTDGIVCEFLSADGGGWRKGKVRLCLEFEEAEEA
jgi:hypothetical protein